METRNCQNCKKDFNITEGEISQYQKVDIVIPDICNDCRIKQHFSFWSFGKFRKGLSSLSGQNLITVLPENPRYPIYTTTEWWSDTWNAVDYGIDYDSSKSLFSQLKELQEKVPRPHQQGSNNKNCDYCDDVWDSNNCYLSRSMLECENLMYSYRNFRVKNSIDMTICFDSDKSFNCFNCYNSYNLFYSQNSRECIDSYFLFDCKNCSDCFMSWNLRNKSFCILNVQYTKEDYKEKLKDFNLGSYEVVENLKKQFEEIIKNDVIHRENSNLKTINSEGNFLLNTKDCHNCNTISDSEDCYNALRGMKYKTTIDSNGCWYAELVGNCSCCVNAYNLKYSIWSPSRYSEYLDNCIECEYCFACVGLKKKRYCILNKQYTKEEYEVLRGKIIDDMKKNGEYGKFLPYNMSTSPFNFSTSFLYFPETTKEEILKLGGYWEDVNESHIEGMSTSELPNNIKDVPDSITTQALICPETGWRFNISLDELSFYRNNNIPLPRYHFDFRTKKYLKYLTSLSAENYKCCYCKNDIKAYYKKDWGYESIACVDCYQKNLN